MILAFLQGELNSTRFGENINHILNELKLSEKLITSPDLKNEEENKLRKEILTYHRSYATKEGLFAHFPDFVKWYETTIPKELVPNLRYIEYSYWTEITGGSRRVKDAVETIKSGKQVFNQSNEGFLNAADAVRKGMIFPPLILVTRDEPESAIILEGHLRATAYALALDQTPEQIPVIIGISSGIDNWNK